MGKYGVEVSGGTLIRYLREVGKGSGSGRYRHRETREGGREEGD